MWNPSTPTNAAAPTRGTTSPGPVFGILPVVGDVGEGCGVVAVEELPWLDCADVSVVLGVFEVPCVGAGVGEDVVTGAGCGERVLELLGKGVPDEATCEEECFAG